MMLSRRKSWAQCLGQNHPVYRLGGMERRIESMAMRKLSHLSVTRKKSCRKVSSLSNSSIRAGQTALLH